MINILIVRGKDQRPMRWYFEHSVDDYPEDFEQAKKLAMQKGLYIGEERDDILTEFFEFENWANGLTSSDDGEPYFGPPSF